MSAGEFTVGEREAAIARLPFIERGMTGVVNDVVTTRFEFRGHARERRGVSGDFGEAHRLDAPENARDAFALGFRAGQIAGRIRDQQHAEFALLAPFGVEARRHQVGGRVAPRQSALERREPAAQVECFPGNVAAGGIVHHRQRLAARGEQRACQRRMQRECAELCPSAFTRAAFSDSLWNSRPSRSQRRAAKSWLCEKIAAELPPVSSEARQVSREPRRDSAATMRCAVPGTRRERVETLARDGASGRSRNGTGGTRFHEVAEPRVHGPRISARQHVQVDARDASLARGACAQQATQLRGEGIRGRDAGGGAPGDRRDRTVLRRLREARQVLGRVFDHVEAQAIEASESHQQKGGARAAALAQQAARYRRHVAGVAAHHAMLQPVADDAAESLVDVRGGAARRHAAQAPRPRWPRRARWPRRPRRRGW